MHLQTGIRQRRNRLRPHCDAAPAMCRGHNRTESGRAHQAAGGRNGGGNSEPGTFAARDASGSDVIGVNANPQVSGMANAALNTLVQLQA